MIKIDGIFYNAEWVRKSLKQAADILNGENSGRLQGTGDMYLDYVGTFINHSGQIHRSANCTDAEWNNLFLVLANPINKHTVVFPFGNQKMGQDIYISKVVRILIEVDEDGNGKKWEKAYEITFTAMNSAWRPGYELQGLI